MTDNGLDPVIHVPARLRIVVTLAALPDGDDLSFTRLQDLIELTPGNLITHLRKLQDAGYVRTERNGSGVTPGPRSCSRRSAGPLWTTTPRCCASCSTAPASASRR
jgi:DNA-binding transcriptional ArsR family regulator